MPAGVCFGCNTEKPRDGHRFCEACVEQRIVALKNRKFRVELWYAGLPTAEDRATREVTALSIPAAHDLVSWIIRNQGATEFRITSVSEMKGA